MQKMKLHTPNLADENFARLAALFPNAVTETTDADGKVIRAIDKDVLMQEINCYVVDGKEERYQFTWPDKKKSVLLANAPSTNTLRPCAEESVGRGGEAGGFDSENLYIEGDNLEVLKLLKETYLHKIKMIYIDPPYNTGNDFIYNDSFQIESEEFKIENGELKIENDGSVVRMVKNFDSNGRFHTDWLNMIYPRLRLAKDLLTDDGVIFISIDDNEVENLKKVCDEIFGESNFVAEFPWRKRTAKSDVPFGVSQDYEWIVCYSRSSNFKASIEGKERNYFETEDFPGKPWRFHDLTKQTTASERPNSFFTIVNPKNGEEFPANQNRTWAITKETFDEYYQQDRIIFPDDYDFLNISKPVLRYWKEDDIKKAGEDFGRIAVSTKLPDEIGMSQDGTKEITELFEGKVFSYPKPTSLLKFFIKIATQNPEPATKNSQFSTLNSPLILDFFSGSATTAHAVMQLNAEDGGNRKFIMVQLPEKCDESSEAFKAGYKNICEIGKERIRRAGKLIIENEKLKDKSSSLNDLFSKDNSQLSTVNSQFPIDIGFRVLKLDSSNMQEVYYTPQATDQQMLSGMVDNIKPDRTDMDLLFQVMLEYGISLSSKIECKKIDGKDVYFVEDTFLAACFDKAVNDAVVTEIAKAKPQYVALRDMDSDATLTNFEQIFNAISPETVCKVV